VIQTIAGATQEVKKSFQNALPLELALIKLTSETTPQNEILARLEHLEKAIAALQNSGIEEPQALKAEPRLSRAALPQPEPEAAREIPQAATAAIEQGSFDWDGFLDKVKQKKRTVGALIQEGKPAGFDGMELVVEFPPNLKFHIENLALPQNKELLENVLLSIYGKPIKITCIPQNTKSKAESPAEKKPAAPDLLQQAVSLFGGKVEPISKEE
jgi:hypothetical protein